MAHHHRVCHLAGVSEQIARATPANSPAAYNRASGQGAQRGRSEISSCTILPFLFTSFPSTQLVVLLPTSYLLRRNTIDRGFCQTTFHSFPPLWFAIPEHKVFNSYPSCLCVFCLLFSLLLRYTGWPKNNRSRTIFISQTRSYCTNIAQNHENNQLGCVCYCCCCFWSKNQLEPICTIHFRSFPIARTTMSDLVNEMPMRCADCSFPRSTPFAFLVPSPSQQFYRCSHYYSIRILCDRRW